MSEAHVPELLEKFKDIQIIIPDIYALLLNWHVKVNNAYPQVHPQMNVWLLSWIKDSQKRKHIINADLAKLAAAFYPNAKKEQYRTMAYYLGWIFVWDDEIDCGSLTDDDAGTKLYQKQTNDYLTYCLGPSPFDGGAPVVCNTVEAFNEIGFEIQSGCSSNVRARILGELQEFVNKVCQLEKTRHHSLPKVEEYLKQREKSVGATISIALLEYVYGLDIPEDIMKHEAMQSIWFLTDDLVLLTNDMMSFAKELRDNQFDNLIPLLVYHYNLSPQAAMDWVAELVYKAYIDFNAAERRIPLPTGDARLDQDVRRFVQGCKDIVVGSVYWSYGNKRYFDDKSTRDGNCIILNL